MKKLFLMAALVTGSMFAATRTTSVQAAPATVVTEQAAQTADDNDELRKSCPVYAPKCCGALPSGCVNCVGMFDECP
jgi:hypothetical protein